MEHVETFQIITIGKVEKTHISIALTTLNKKMNNFINTVLKGTKIVGHYWEQMKDGRMVFVNNKGNPLLEIEPANFKEEEKRFIVQQKCKIYN
jgi:hypothetical protein